MPIIHNPNRDAARWLEAHDPEHDWKARAEASPDDDYVGAVLDNLHTFGVGDNDRDREIVRDAIAIVHEAWIQRRNG